MDNKKIEDKIFNEVIKIIGNGKKISSQELSKIIETEVKNKNYLKNDWQNYYAVERIKERIIKEYFNLFPTTWKKRFLHHILDNIIASFLFALLGSSLGMMGLFLAVIIVGLYYIIFESIWGKTPAKFLTRTRVIMETGEKPSSETIFIRTLIRFIPFEPFTFLGSKNPRGWHDKWSKTIVIDDK